MNSKKELAVFLSRLQSFEKPSWRLEQYPTDSEVAADVIWNAYQLGDITGKTIADLGCGTGILGIGALRFDPRKAYFVDIDEKALSRLKENLLLFDTKTDCEIETTDVARFIQHVDTVIQNPPFGVKAEHADKIFLEKAFSIAEVVYSLHKLSTKEFIERTAKVHNFTMTHFWRYDFPLKQTQSYHTKKIQRIEVGCWRFRSLEAVFS